MVIRAQAVSSYEGPLENLLSKVTESPLSHYWLMATGSGQAAASAECSVSALLKSQLRAGPLSERCWDGRRAHRSKTTLRLHAPAPSLPESHSGPRSTLENHRSSSLGSGWKPGGSWRGSVAAQDSGSRGCSSFG
mmetsp:Transcript_52342/g.93923  ORF Transcript_52342/g.93923 Transcript_52342/m.93923 type:complete len:135 (+) Transcript_52342:647-1051(+)